MWSSKHPSPGQGSQRARLEEEQGLTAPLRLCFTPQKRALEIFPQPVTLSQAGDLSAEGAERPHPSPQQSALEPGICSSGLEQVLEESPPAKASARAEYLEGPLKGQGLGLEPRCPCTAGFEPRPSDLTPPPPPRQPRSKQPPHPKENAVTLCQDDQAGAMVADGGHAMAHPSNVGPLPTTSLRKTKKTTGR